MAITFSIDNDRNLTGFQLLTLDETAGTQTTLDTNGAPNDVDDDVDAAYNSTTNVLTSAALDTAFITFISNLFPSDPAEDNALGFLATVKGASSSNTFIQVTADAGETVSNLFFSLAPSSPTGLISSVTTLDNEALYFHINSNSDFATLTTSSGLGGKIVGAFYLDEDDDGVGVDHLTAQVQMVTFEALKNTVTTDPDDPINFSDVLQVSAAGSLSFTFNKLPSGNFLYAAFGDTTAALLVTGNDLAVNHDPNSSSYGKVISNSSDTVNTSQAAKGSQATIGIDAQHFTYGGSGKNKTDGSVADFTLVSGFVPLQNSTVPATGVNVQDIDYAGYVSTIGAGINISQLTGGNAHADMRISLWRAGGGTTPEEGFSYIDNDFSNELVIADDTALNDDTRVTVGQVVVKHLGATLIFNYSAGGSTIVSGVRVTFGDAAHSNEFAVTGLAGLDTVDFTAANGATFNRFKLQALATTSAFDLGAVRLSEGTTASVGLGSHLLVDDDGPSIAGNAEVVPTLTNDDTQIPDSAGPTSFAGLFTSAFGTDSFKDSDDNNIQDADAITYALGVKNGGSNVASGLTDTLSGDAVVLNKVGNDVVGTITGTATEVFRITVNANTGAVTFTQSRSVVHNDPADPSETGASAAGLSTADLVTLTATITDGDGDTANATRDIGNAFKFEDDGPSISGNATAPTTLTNDDTQIPDSAGPTSFAGLFTSAFGTDSFKDSNDDNIQDTDAITYALGVKNGGSNVASGLTDTLSGDAVVLNKVGNDVVGTITGTATEVFRITVNANTGAVTFTQSRSVVHNDPADPSETGASAAGLSAADLVTLTATITDGDGDTANATRDIGNAFKFEDDGPSISGNATAPTTLTNDDTQIPDSAGPTSFAGLFTSAFGTDSFKDSDDNNIQDADAITYALGVKNGGSNVASGLTDTLSGDAVVLNKVGNDVVGTITGTATEVFRITVNANTGAVTFTQSRSVVHNDPADPSETGASAAGLSAADLVTLTATITDGDGDTANATRDIGNAFKFEDDGPTIGASAALVPTLTTDDTSIPDSEGPTSFVGVFTSSFGADGFKDANDDNIQDADAITYALGVKNGGSNVASGLTDTLSGHAVVLNKVGNDVVGTITGTTTEVFRITMTATGSVTLTQSRSVVHNDSTDPAETGASAAGLSAADLVTLTATITDGDGDTASATRDIGFAFKFEDTGPSAFNPEDIIANPTLPKEPVQNQPGETATRDLSGDAALTDLTTVNTYTGKDGYGSVSFTGFTNGDILQGTIQDGTPILENLKGKAPGDISFSDVHLYGAGTNTLIAVAGTDPTIVGDRVFTITLAPGTDQYTFTMLGQLSNGAQTINLNFVGQHPTGYDWLTLDLPGDDPGDVGLGANNKEDAGELDGDFLFTAIQRSALDGPITSLPGVGNAVVKVSSTGIGVGSQSINPLDGIFIDFIDHASRTLGGNDIDVTPLDFTNHVTYNNAGFAISQLKPNASASVDVRVSAYNETSADPAASAAQIVNDAQLDIVAITVRSGTSFHEFTGDESVTIGGRSITVDFNPANAPVVGANDGLHDWFVDISNLGESYEVLIKTANGFERMLVEDSGTANEGFDIERIIIDEFDAGAPIDLKFDLRLTDGDGDFVDMQDLLGVTLTPPDTIL